MVRIVRTVILVIPYDLFKWLEWLFSVIKFDLINGKNGYFTIIVRFV